MSVLDRRRMHVTNGRGASAPHRGGRRRRSGKRVAAVLLVTAAHALLAGVGAARAAASQSVPLGVDVSYPQCGAPLPTGHAFAIVGVTGGTAITTNPCLGSQLAWAAGSTGGTAHDRVQLYVNTANPGPAAASWPHSGSNRYGICDGSVSGACSYRYGWDRAHDDATGRGIAHPERYMWWLDVEIANTWDYAFGGHRRNAAVLEGMTDYFRSIGVRGVGIYSTRYQWDHVAGDGVMPDSSLNGLPNWRPAGADLAAAQATCGVAPLTRGGAVTITQYTTDYDYNYSCI